MQAINARTTKLDAYFKRVAAYPYGEELTADLAKLGAVYVCGYVERCVEIVILERLTGRAHPRVTAFIRGHFKRGTNYDCEAISQLLARFDRSWEAEFRNFLSKNDKLISSIKSAYTVRNAVAHGGEGNLGLAGVTELYRDAKNLVLGLIQSTDR